MSTFLIPPTHASEISRILSQEMSQEIVGHEGLIERLLVALICNGHVLLEGLPGLAKTKTLSSMAKCLSLQMKRVQFTPDLLPSDVIGTEVYRPQTGEFTKRHGPIFANILLADEINRAPAKVQSALLQAMQERCVTIGEDTIPLPSPFLVLATQNPIEHEGTYPLPEAQLDRFLFKILVGYPSEKEEVEIIRKASSLSGAKISQVIDLETINKLTSSVQSVHVEERIDRYIVSLVSATRSKNSPTISGLLDWGASPRAGISLRSAARALAYIRGSDHVSPDDVKELTPDVFRHRILLSFEAETRGISSDDIIASILKETPIP